MVEFGLLMAGLFGAALATLGLIVYLFWPD